LTPSGRKAVWTGGLKLFVTSQGAIVAGRAHRFVRAGHRIRENRQILGQFLAARIAETSQLPQRENSLDIRIAKLYSSLKFWAFDNSIRR